MKTLSKMLAVAALLISPALWAAGAAPQQLIVSGMTCGSCAAAITQAFLKNPAVKDVSVDVKTGKVVLTFKDNQSMSEAQIRETVKGAGYKVQSVAPSAQG